MNKTSDRALLPYLMLVFFNTFVDLGHKVLIQDTIYQTAQGAGYTMLSAIINALILLPYLLLFTPCGFIADKFSKAGVLKVTAAAAIPLTLLVTFFYYKGYFWSAFVATLLLAAQSALNSPAKYGYIKEVFGKAQLTKINAIVQTLTIIAILSATFAFTYVFSCLTAPVVEQTRAELLRAFAPSGWFLVLFSVVETMMTFWLIPTPAADPHSRLHLKPYLKSEYLKSYLKQAREPRLIFACIMGLSVFWAVNQVLLASYGAYLLEYVGHVSVLFAQGSLAVGGIGILLGALYAGRVSKGGIETGLIPLSTVGLAVCLLILPFSTHRLGIVGLFLIYGFFGGMLVVPLNALMQFNAPQKALGKILSANNFIQNVFMLAFLVLTIATGFIGMNSRYLLLALAVIACVGVVYAVVSLPMSLVRYLSYVLVSKFYRIRVHHLEHVPSTGGVLLLGNHVSFVDWAILQTACPRPIRFVMDKSIYDTWYLTPLFKLFKAIPIAPGASQTALKTVRDALNSGDVVAIFPEGRLSRNGQMSVFKSGFERAATDVNAVIIAFYIHGLWGSKTSYGKTLTLHKKRFARVRVSLTFGRAMPIASTAPTVRQSVHELSILAWKYATSDMGNLAYEWLFRAKKMKHDVMVIDENHQPFSAYRVLSGVFHLVRRYKKLLRGSARVGVMLPSSAGGALANLALFCLGKTVVNLNYTAGLATCLEAIRQAELSTIITSKRFLKKLEARGFDATSLSEHIQWIDIEDAFLAKENASLFMSAVITRILPASLLARWLIEPVSSETTAAILFSSGSEGLPKGIELSHANLLSNMMQLISVTGLTDGDRVFSALPLFHAFGLTVTMLLPLVYGIPMICCADPTKVVPASKLIFRHKATLLCSTSSMLGLYARNDAVHPSMLSSLKLVIAGAEKLSPLVAQQFSEKFHLPIYEGYGATEVSPVASCNLPDVICHRDWQIHQAHKKGSVGLPLPGCAFRIVDPHTLDNLPIGEHGLILIGGVQVMKGYLNHPQKTRDVLFEEGGMTWYKTGDKGFMDEQGFLTIVDRYSRCAKIAGEMISLSQAQALFQEVLGEQEIVLVALPDDKKGEQLVLLYVSDISPDAVKARLRQADCPNVWIPKQVLQCQALPKTGSGKYDVLAAKAWCLKALESSSA